MSGDNESRPTIGPSFEVEEAARLFFEQWLPSSWLKRKQLPDVHVDYRVEVVGGGEPSASHFLVQVKGRSFQKRKADRPAEPMRTKHLRYYLQCQEPVFVFLIDPTEKRGYWVLIQRYLNECVRPAQLQGQKSLKVRFDPACSLEDRTRFDTELKAAWAYVRDLHPGAPLAAILAEKRRLEQIDPRFRVHFTATNERLKIDVKPADPSVQRPRFKFSPNVAPESVRAFVEQGKPLRVKTTDVQLEGTALLGEIFKGLGTPEITFENCAKLSGCLRLQVNHGAEVTMVQIAGEWVISPTQASFSGRLSDSPVIVEFSRERQADGSFRPCALLFRMNWDAWYGQPLLGLAYFDELYRILSQKPFLVFAYIRGNPAFRPETISLDIPEGQEFLAGFEWLHKCREVARLFGVNPVPPHLKELEKREYDEVRLVVKLVDSGFHEQDNADQVTTLTAERPDPGKPLAIDAACVELPESARRFSFFGTEIPFGPLVHKWTMVQVTQTRVADDNRVDLELKGGPHSTYRIEYTGPRLPAEQHHD